jgi:hypothetical protein
MKVASISPLRQSMISRLVSEEISGIITHWHPLRDMNLRGVVLNQMEFDLLFRPDLYRLDIRSRKSTQILIKNFIRDQHVLNELESMIKDYGVDSSNWGLARKYLDMIGEALQQSPLRKIKIKMLEESLERNRLESTKKAAQ